MHGDYQVAYCPITQIISLAFRDEAFLNTALTPELIWRLRVPKRSQSLPVRWKQEKLNLPLLRRVEQTPYGYEVHTSLPMMYDSSRQALKYLGRDAGFDDELGHYNYRGWTANEANRTSPLNKFCLDILMAEPFSIFSMYLTRCPQGTLPVRSGRGPWPVGRRGF